MIVDVDSCGQCPLGSYDSELSFLRCNHPDAHDLDIDLNVSFFEPLKEPHPRCPLIKRCLTLNVVITKDEVNEKVRSKRIH